MGLFNWFKTRQEKPDELTANVLPEIKREDFVDDSAPRKNNSITITYGTGMPIDLIYSFLKEDYEAKGYDDALSNPDVSYKEKNKSIIKSNLEIKFKQVRLKYVDILREIDFHVSSRQQAGLVDLVRELENKKETYEHHLEELNKMEQDFANEEPYMTGMLILIILWGFTGFCFAQRYVGAPLWGCVLSALIFIVIVIQIERQIILTVGTNKWGACFRFFIAIIMSVLGSAILDQIIFGEDIKRKMIEITDRQVQEQLPLRLNVIDERLHTLQIEIDSLSKVNMQLDEEIAKRPTTTTVSTTTTYKNELQEDGSYKKIPETTVSSIPIPNPRIEQRDANKTNLDRLRKQQDEFIQNKLSVENDLREELSSNIGFLEELRAMIEIISTRLEALIFYIVIFSFLISLELFVVTSKLGDKKCDYDLIVEHQLEIKKAALEELVKNVKDGK